MEVQLVKYLTTIKYSLLLTHIYFIHNYFNLNRELVESITGFLINKFQDETKYTILKHEIPQFKLNFNHPCRSLLWILRK
jgi:hypothetical protein